MSSIGELTFFLGLQVMQRDDGIFISQDKYVADILKKFDFVTIVIGLLMYLTASRPDIMFAVCACARLGFGTQFDPDFQPDTHVMVSYAGETGYGQMGVGLGFCHGVKWGSRDSPCGVEVWGFGRNDPSDSPFDLEAFSNSDYAGASLDKKSTTGGVMDSKSNA
ncbi:hypothetical protein Tco_0260956 [Tanacetum coccineum]